MQLQDLAVDAIKVTASFILIFDINRPKQTVARDIE